MAVESRFVVIRNGVEAKTFMDKKSADEYDKMLDMADNLSQMFSHSSVELTDSATEELSIFLAQHREEVLVALLAKKPAKKATAKPLNKVVDEPLSKPEPLAKSITKSITKSIVHPKEIAEVKKSPEKELTAQTKKSKLKAVKTVKEKSSAVN